jgi:hypothetical protein
MKDLSPCELADRLALTRPYTAQELGAGEFRDRDGSFSTSRSILVSVETRDAVVASLRNWR